jgi:RNA polymerase sigma-B factor
MTLAPEIFRASTPPSNTEQRDGVVRDLYDQMLDASEGRVRELKEDVITVCLPWADAVSRRFRSRGIADDDLVQVGRLGLLEAVERYRPGPCPFSGFAYPTITGKIKKHFRDQGWMVRPPRRLQEAGSEVTETVRSLSQELGRHPTDHEVAEQMHVRVEEVREVLTVSSCFRPGSIDAPGSHDGVSIGENLRSSDKDLELAELKMVLGPAVRQLSEQDRELLRLRFVEDLVQQQIAERLGVSQMHVSRRLRRIFSSLRQEIGEIVAIPLASDDAFSTHAAA